MTTDDSIDNIHTTDTKKHIMLVEDDTSLAEWISNYLITQGYEVSLATRGDEAVNMIREDNPDLVILDITLPVKDGFEICREVRAFYDRPILMMTARNEEMDEVLGLEMGADDYVTKPVRPRALLARIKGLIRRQTVSVSNNQETTRIEFDNFVIDSTSRTTTINKAIISISSNEFDVLWWLASNAGKTVSRKELIAQLRGIEYDGFDRSMDILVSRLRKKLSDDPSTPYRIKTIWGKGYLFAPDAWKS